MAAALPAYVTQRPLRTFRPGDLADEVANPRVQVARWVERGVVKRLANGYATAIPDDRGADWAPTIEAAAAGIATTIYGARNVALMGLTAARVHQAMPRAVANGIVAVPEQHRPVTLAAGGQVIFVKRDLNRLDLRVESTDLGRTLVTTPEQTLVDLLARPGLGGQTAEAHAAALNLLPICDVDRVVELATAQRAAAPVRAFLRDAA